MEVKNCRYGSEKIVEPVEEYMFYNKLKQETWLRRLHFQYVFRALETMILSLLIGLLEFFEFAGNLRTKTTDVNV